MSSSRAVRRPRPYVDRPVRSRTDATTLATTYARRWGLDSPELLRFGMNGIYAAGDVVLRVGHATAPATVAHELHFALAERGLCVTCPVEGLTADEDGFVVTGWERVYPQPTELPDWEALGAQVAALHAMPVDGVPSGYPVADPTGFAWWNIAEHLHKISGHIDQAALDGLSAAADRNRGWADAVGIEPVVCHGDFHPGNVLGANTMIDFDLMSLANRAWDHAMLLSYTDRWGGPPGAYEAFANGYGANLVDDEIAQCLAETRNLVATVMRVLASLDNPAARAEAERRLRYWRGEPDAPPFSAQ